MYSQHRHPTLRGLSLRPLWLSLITVVAIQIRLGLSLLKLQGVKFVAQKGGYPRNSKRKALHKNSIFRVVCLLTFWHLK